MKEKFHYKKEMGQHFIFDPSVIEALADVSLVGRDDGVLEIGPGRGTLTAALARRARKVITVELDRTLIRGLEVSMELYPNVEIVEGDILRQDLHALAAELGTPCRIAANLPYNITTPLLEKLLHAHLPFETIAIMVQMEVGERMSASPGEEGYGPFSILIDYFATVEEAMFIPSRCFTPPPKVDSSFMLLTMRKQPAVDVADEALFFRVVRAAFSMRRKTILNNLTGGLSLSRVEAEALLDKCGIVPNMRAERMTISDFACLANELVKTRAESRNEETTDA